MSSNINLFQEKEFIMSTKFFNNNGIVSFYSISSEEDLNLKPKISINPPPSDGRCYFCGRHVSELKTLR
jgi:hypothetical protein